jgi:hypothetical protein
MILIEREGMRWNEAGRQAGKQECNEEVAEGKEKDE